MSLDEQLLLFTEAYGVPEGARQAFVRDIKATFEEAGYAPAVKMKPVQFDNNFQSPKLLMTGQEVISKLENHYWDSLNNHKDLIIKHVKGALDASD